MPRKSNVQCIFLWYYLNWAQILHDQLGLKRGEKTTPYLIVAKSTGM